MQNISPSKKILLLKGFSPKYLECDWEDTPVFSPSRLIKLVKEFKISSAVFVYKDEGQVIDASIKEGVFNITDMKGIDFPEYFSSSFDSSFIPTSRFLYIYNIGDEPVKDFTIPDRKLFLLVQKNLEKGNIVILSSQSLTSTGFTRQYPKTSTLITKTQQILR